MCLEVVFKCILVSTSISRRITTVHFRACVYLSISLSLSFSLCVCVFFLLRNCSERYSLATVSRVYVSYTFNYS